MYSNKLYTPLRYPGGKARFAPFLAMVMEKNNLVGGHYLEPYAGGAGAALELLFHGYATHVHINDLDPAVYAFWRSCIDFSDELIKLLTDTSVSMDEWFRWRAILREEVPASIVERGFATLFMNRTNRSGILKGGVIGGKDQAGSYKLDARLKKDALVARIERIADHREKITVYCEDAFGLLKRAGNILPKSSLIYLDPPYYVKGQGLYRNFYKHDDHLAIAKLIQSKSFRRPWVVSYDAADQIKEMYKSSKGLAYGLHYTAQARYTGNEVMFFSDRIDLPEIDPLSKAS